MAKPIGETPTLKGKSARRFIRKKDNHQNETAAEIFRLHQAWH